jgi:hypothetical protein
VEEGLMGSRKIANFFEKGLEKTETFHYNTAL